METWLCSELMGPISSYSTCKSLARIYNMYGIDSCDHSLVHVYFIAQQLSDSLTPRTSYPVSCPQCQYGPFIASVKGGRAGYDSLLDSDLLLDSEGRPRASIKEERVEGEGAV